jgi:hypothetical protein
MTELLRAWDSFYVIVGSAAGALIGLQFVVLTLAADRPPTPEAGAAFAAPTIVHFSAALFLSALQRAPWETITCVAAIWGLTGISGIIYALIVARRMRLQTFYKPDYEDWLFYALLPLAAHAMLVLAALAAPFRTREALFGVGAAALMLFFLGIRNSWDSIAYHVLVSRKDRKTEGHQDETGST